MLRSAAFALLIAGVSMAAPVPKELRQPQLVGVWKIESILSSGQPGSPVGDHWTIEANGDLHAHVGPCVPERAIAPNRLIFDHAVRGVDFFQLGNRANFPGLYALSGDKLTISFNMVD